MANSVPEPTVVFYKSAMCGHCTSLTNIWEPGAKNLKKGEKSVTEVLKEVYPKIRFFVVTAKDNTGKFDENTAPKDLIRYGKWFPMILLVPGRVWDAAMANLGPKNTAQILDGVQMLNCHWNDKEKQELKYQQKYDIRKPEDFGRWLKEGLANDEFKRIQDGNKDNGSNNNSVSTTQSPSQPIQPLMTPLTRTNNNNVSHTSSSRTFDPPGDICSMRIISRPR